MKPVLHGCAGVSLDRSYLMDSEADRYFGEGQVQDAKRVVFVVDDEPVIAQPLALILNQLDFGLALSTIRTKPSLLAPKWLPIF